MPAGRPSKITEDIIRKLEEAFYIDCTVGEACSRAGIGTSTYYEHIEKNKEFADKMRIAQDFAITSARAILFKSMKEANDGMGDGRLALEVVKRRDKKRYSDRTEQTGEDGGAIETSLTIKFE
jgi:hypothetical protein